MTKLNCAASLSIPETTGVDRNGEVVVGGVPIQRGTLREGGWFNLNNDAGSSYPAEGSPAAYWPDGSIKWLHVCGTVDLEGGKQNKFQLTPAAEPPGDTLEVEQAGGAVAIRNGDFQVRVSPSASNAVEVKYGSGEGAKALLAAPGISAAMVLCGVDGDNRREFALSFENAEMSLVVETANRVVVRLPGVFGKPESPVSELILFIEVLKGAPQLRIEPVFIYLGHPDNDLVASLTLTAHTAHGGEATRYGFANEQGRGYWDVLQMYEGGAQWPQARHIQLSSSSYHTEKRVSAQSPWVKATEGGRSQGWCHLGDECGGVTAAMRYFWQEYPRSLMVDTEQNTLTFGLVPHGAPPLDLRRYSPTIYGKPAYEFSSGEFPTETHGAGGIAKASELMLHFHTEGKEAAEASAARHSLFFNQPSRLVAEPEYFAATKVVGQLAPRREGVFEESEEDLARIMDFMVQERDVRGWYGLMNYGDMMLAYYTDIDRWAYDDGGYAWINNEHLPDLGLWMQALRSGQSDWIEAAIAMTRHNRDVDTYHRGPMKGAGTRHNVNHWGCKDKEWRVSMPLVKRLHYYLTADPWTAEVIRATVAVYQSYERTAGFVSIASALAGIMVKCELDNQDEDWQTLKNLTNVFTRAFREDGEVIGQIQADLATGEGEPVGDVTMTHRSYFVNKFGGQHTLTEIAQLLEDEALKDGIVRHANFIVSMVESPEESDAWRRSRSSVHARDYAQIAKNPEEAFRKKLLFAIQPFLGLAYRHTGDARYLKALEKTRDGARVEFLETGGDGPLDEPRHSFLPGLERRNKIMCHLGEMLHLAPYGLAETGEDPKE